MHHHYTNSEWLYILKGDGVLLLSAAPTQPHAVGGIAPVAGDPDAHIEELDVGPGDFVGFKGRPSTLEDPAWAHSMRAGSAGMEYLVGGTRKEMDLCVYPL